MRNGLTAKVRNGSLHQPPGSTPSSLPESLRGRLATVEETEAEFAGMEVGDE